MARNGSGTYALPLSAVVADTTITATWANTTMNDLATALTGSIAKDGQTLPTANLPMNSNKHTGVANAAARTDYLAAGQAVDGVPAWFTAGGTVDVITGTMPLAGAAYATGQRFSFVATGANTTNVTLNLSGIGAKAVTKNGATALAAGDIPSAGVVEVVYDGTQFQLLSPLPAAQYTGNAGIVFPSGCEIVYAGPSTPTGWVVQAAADNHAIKFSSTRPAAGDLNGSVNFTTAFTSQAVSGTNANEASHVHNAGSYSTGAPNVAYTGVTTGGTNVSNTVHTHVVSGQSAVGSAHTHTFTGTAINLAVKYQNMCSLRKT